MKETDYIALNKASWNDRTAYHLNSEFYDVKGFLEGKSSLNTIELELLGDVRGKKILHLQCHFGQDTLSLARMGAQTTGIDLSDKAIEAARDLNTQLGLDAKFICCDLYSLPEYLDEQFDIVFTSYGTIGWLPDIQKWAGIVSRFLKPKGCFVFADFHPVVWMFDNDFQKVAYNYFTADAIVETLQGTYADKEAKQEFSSISWNHGLAEVVTALLKEDLTLTHLQEFDYSPYNCFSGMKERASGEYIIEHLEGKIPMVYALRAIKK